MFGNCNHCCFCCGHPCTMLGVSLLISCKNKIQCVCVKKKKENSDKEKKKKQLLTHSVFKTFKLIQHHLGLFDFRGNILLFINFT